MKLYPIPSEFRGLPMNPYLEYDDPRSRTGEQLFKEAVEAWRNLVLARKAPSK